MKEIPGIMPFLFFGLSLSIFVSCKEKNRNPEAVTAINLKRGEIVVCGPADKEFGSVGFAVSCSGTTKKEFDLAIALLHSFEYDEAEKGFAKVIDLDPTCAMAYWGVAMSNYHPLWAPPTQAELEKGASAIAIAQSLAPKEKEAQYINAIASFYKDWDTVSHQVRSNRFMIAMEKIYADHPDDKEAAVFYALSLIASADPTDKSFARQKKAGSILNGLYPGRPDHPGIVHYIIHAYDSPELAQLGLEAAKKYASVAPSSAHALHMPSHIFTRLGLWEECIRSNLASVNAAKCYAEAAGIKGHWDEELHGLDYLVYAYLQKGDNDQAKKQSAYLETINEVNPVNFKVTYAFAAIPSRYFLENKFWTGAARLAIPAAANIDWGQYPWQKAILHFTRLMGAVHTNQLDAADMEWRHLQHCYDTLTNQKDSYKAKQVQIQLQTAKAWILLRRGKKEEALKAMYAAADLEDGIEKHPVTPGEVIPARELLGDMLLELNKPGEAFIAYETDLARHANRFNGLYGAGLAAEKSNNPQKATYYYQQLVGVAGSTPSARPELAAARLFLNKSTSKR